MSEGTPHFRDMDEAVGEPVVLPESEASTVRERPLHSGLYQREVRTPEEIVALDTAYRSVDDAVTEPDTRQIERTTSPPITTREPGPDYWDQPGMKGA